MLICFHASHDVDLSILPKKGWWRFFLLFFLMYTLFHKGISYSQSSFYCLLSSYQRDTGRYFFSFCKQSLYIVPCIFFLQMLDIPEKKPVSFPQIVLQANFVIIFFQCLVMYIVNAACFIFDNLLSLRHLRREQILHGPLIKPNSRQISQALNKTRLPYSLFFVSFLINFSKIRINVMQNRVCVSCT